MSTSAGPDWSELFAIGDVHAPEFFRKSEDLEALPKPPAQSHAIRQAFRELGVDAVLCLGNTPAVYFKDYPEIDYDVIRELHRRVWNQGLAAVLVVIGPRDVVILSGVTLPAKPEEAFAEGNRIIAVLDRVADALELRQLVLSFETGEFFRQHSKSFDPKLRVDRQLLKNLTGARDRLAAATAPTLDPKILDALLCRVVFTCYLIDREVIGETYFAETGIDRAANLRELFERYPAAEAKDRLYDLFARFRVDFNGDMFQGDLDAERPLIGPAHIGVLRSLLRGDDVLDGQLALGFTTYDFGVIPIETISDIYERFLKAADPEEKRRKGAYYTPRFLAEVVLDTALEGYQSLLGSTFLDPACGSGIFLVGLFNRIAEEWARKNPDAEYDEKADALIQILTAQLFGVDESETACRIAAFSLYLALLDHLAPSDIRKLQARGRMLPRIVFSKDGRRGDDGGRTILNADFFEAEGLLPDRAFDVVIGNPPWASVEGKEKSPMERWCSAPERRLPVADRQLAHGFVWKAAEHQKDGGRICLVLPYGVLLNLKALDFQRALMSRHAVERVLNLADLRFYLFENAIRPSVVVRYRREAPRAKRHSISYYAPKTEWETLRAEIISIQPEDRSDIILSEVLRPLERHEPPLVWKERLWGTPRDWKFLDRLSVLPRLGAIAGGVGEGKRWIKGQGFQPRTDADAGDPPKPAEWPAGQLFVENRQGRINLLLLESDCRPIGDEFDLLRRNPDKEIFRGPHVLMTHGMYAAYADFDVAFRHSIQAFRGPREDADLLRLLAAVLDSPLARYFLFHTAPGWGSERPRALLEDVLRIPFPLPGTEMAPPDAEEIIGEVSGQMRGAEDALRGGILHDRRGIIEALRARLRPLVYRYYDVDPLEQVLIEDTLAISAKSATPSRGTYPIPTIMPSSREERGSYLALLLQQLNRWGSRGGYRVEGEVAAFEPAGLAIAVLCRREGADPRPGVRILPGNATGGIIQAMARIRSLTTRRSGSLHFARGLKLFDGEMLYISKPLARRFWTGTAALNDADEIAAAILSQGARKQG